MAIHQNAGAVAVLNVKAGGGRIYGARATNVNAAVRYLCFVDKVTAPVNGDAVAFWILLPAGTAAIPSITDIGSAILGTQGIQLPTGVSWAVSTTPTTVTAATAAEHTVSFRYQ